MDVLLASFNGERFLDTQLESLARQEDVNVRVWVNDDGSVDETLSILHKWQEKGLIKGKIFSIKAAQEYDLVWMKLYKLKKLQAAQFNLKGCYFF